MHLVYFVNIIYEMTYCKYSLIFIWSKEQEKLYNIEIEKYITLYEIGEFQDRTYGWTICKHCTQNQVLI